ncbi:MAG: potassium transporter Kef [Deltaproteobacteria bacterium]
MSAIALLLGLLVLSYMGGIVRGGRAIKGFGLPSGAEYLCLGFVCGSHVLGLVPEALLEAFQPLLLVGAAWIALVAGLGYTRIGDRRIRTSSALVGVVSAALVGAAVGAAVWFALPLVRADLAPQRRLIAGGMAILSCASTRHAVRWVVLRYAAKGPLSDALADYARASALVPMFGLSLLFAQNSVPGLVEIGFLGRALLTWGIGVILGLVAVLLIGRGLTRDEIWGVIVGTLLLAAGVAAELGLSGVSAAFALGLTLGVLSSHRPQLARMLRPTEPAVLVPLAVLAGTLVSLHDARLLWVLVPLGLGARAGAELLRGALLSLCSRAARPAGPIVGLGMMTLGEITLACAVSIALSFEGDAAQSLLAIGVISMLAGELIGPLALRRALRLANELEAGEPEPGRLSLEPEGNEA